MLFEKSTVGGIDVSCRIIRSATFEGMDDGHGCPKEKLIELYETLADGGVGLIITGMMAVSPKEFHQHRQIRIDDDRFIAPLRILTDRVHAHGGKIMAQLVIMGSAIALPEGAGKAIISPSGIPDKVVVKTQESRALTVDEIKSLIDDAVHAALRAQKAGYDGIQFHGAHGYLASKFLTPFFNKRTDEYGGSLKNRARFLTETIAAIRKAVGPAYPIWVKLNSSDYMETEGLTFDESMQVMAWLADAGANAIEISGGNTSSLPRQGPIRAIRRTKEPMYFAGAAAAAAAALKGRIAIGVVGGFRTAAEMEDCLQKTDIAFISMSRPLLRQPDLPNLWRGGSTEPALCISCSRCFRADDVACIFNEKDK